MTHYPQILPQSIGVAEGIGFQVVDYRTRTAKSGPAVGNTMTAYFEAVEPGYVWEIERMTVQALPTVAVSSASVFAGDPVFPFSWRDGTANGNKSVADERSPIRLTATEVLTVVWTGADNGAIGYAWIQFRVLKRV